MTTLPQALDRPPIRWASAPIGALVLRATLGLVFIAHAVLKIDLGFTQVEGFFEHHGFPGWTVYPVFVVELIGGLLLVGGIATAWTAAALLAVVAGAFRVHAENGWYFASPNGGWEYLVVLAAGLMAVALIGPGALRPRESSGRTAARSSSKAAD